jgi:hypothetical protein
MITRTTQLCRFEANMKASPTGPCVQWPLGSRPRLRWRLANLTKKPSTALSQEAEVGCD